MTKLRIMIPTTSLLAAKIVSAKLSLNPSPIPARGARVLMG